MSKLVIRYSLAYFKTHTHSYMYTETWISIFPYSWLGKIHSLQYKNSLPWLVDKLIRGYKVKIPKSSLIILQIPIEQEKFLEPVGKTFFLEPIKFDLYLNYQISMALGLQAASWAPSASSRQPRIPTSTSSQISKSWWMTASKTQRWFKSKWQSR